MSSPRGWKRSFEDPIRLPPQSPACHSRGCRQLHHEASQGQARSRGVAGGDGSPDPGGDIGRADDVRADRRGAVPSRSREVTLQRFVEKHKR
jgi:hypothetical protein